MRRRFYKKSRKGFGIIIVVVLLLCGLISFRKNDLKTEYTMKAQEISRLEKQKQELVDEQQDIDEYRAYVKTKKYIEQIAREKLGLVFKDEIVFEEEE